MDPVQIERQAVGRIRTYDLGKLAIIISRWPELPPRWRRLILKHPRVHELRECFDLAAFGLSPLLREEPDTYSRIDGEGWTKTLRDTIRGLQRDFVLELEPAYQLRNWEDAATLLGRQRGVCYAGCAGLWSGDGSGPGSLLLRSAREIQVAEYLRVRGIHPTESELSGCVALALWEGNWRSQENLGKEFECVCSDAQRAFYWHQNDGRYNNLGDLDADGGNDIIATAVPLDPMFPAPEEIRIAGPVELAFLREKIRRIGLKVGLEKEEARFLVKMAIDGAEWKDDPTAWRKIRDRKRGPLLKAIGDLLRENPYA